MDIRATTAIVEVKDGRRELYSAVGMAGVDGRIPITISGYVIGAWGPDDGNARDFYIAVETAKIGG
jgi:hypothetical protein